MCSVAETSMSNLFSSDLFMENKPKSPNYCSILLELSATNNLLRFKEAFKENPSILDEQSFWYSRLIGSKRICYVLRTPLMIAAMYGSIEVLKFILSVNSVDVNRASNSDRASALHCAVAGGASLSIEIVKLLLEAGADSEMLDINGNRPRDVIPPPPLSKTANSSRLKALDILLNGGTYSETDTMLNSEDEIPKEEVEKKEYPIDLSLPDIKNGMYGTDEFRMYTFKVKPCSRAYSHDWTECPFVHPGENARRRDPRKYHYSCVPCPEFRKGSCRNGDACEYAHGVFECWLHPAQYRTRLCKDETSCNRRVCFFAHKPEELRPLYPSTGSAVPSPRSSPSPPSLSSFMDMATINSFGLGSTPPMSPSSSSPMSTGAWNNQVLLPALQLPGSRLKSTLSARDMTLDMDMLDLDIQQLQFIDDISNLRSQYSWPNNTLDSSLLSQMQGMPLQASLSSSQFQSPSASPIRSSMNMNMPSSAARFDHPTMAATLLNSRAAAFAKRSQSFCDRGTITHPVIGSNSLSDWASPDGKLDWGIQGEELNKMRRSSSFGLRGGNTIATPEPDVSWVQSLVKDVPSSRLGFENPQYSLNNGGSSDFHPLEIHSSWSDQLHVETEQIVA